MKVSIITPSYNQAQYIERTILSVIKQKGNFSLEYIVMDWWSNDWTVEILKKYEKIIKEKYPKVTYIWKSEKDKGQTDAINKWLKIATGDILAYINSDDTYQPWAIQNAVTSLKDEKFERCYGKCYIINNDDQEIRKPITRYKNLLLRNRSYAKLLTENFISQMTVFWTRNAMDKVWLFDEQENLTMDYEYLLRLWKYFGPKVNNTYIANFRFYTTSKSWSYFFQQFKDQLRLAKKYAMWKYKLSILIHKIFYYRTIILYKLFSLFKW